MIVYLDTSALIPLLVDEPSTGAVERLWLGAWWAITSRITYAEARAGLARARRMARITAGELRIAVAGLESIIRNLYHVEVTEKLVTRAGDLAEQLELRGYNAVHLAAAESVNHPGLVMASGDRRLVSAAGTLGLGTALV